MLLSPQDKDRASMVGAFGSKWDQPHAQDEAVQLRRVECLLAVDDVGDVSGDSLTASISPLAKPLLRHEPLCRAVDVDEFHPLGDHEARVVLVLQELPA